MLASPPAALRTGTQSRDRVRQLWTRLRQAARGDRGEVTVELVIATPLLLLTLLTIIQLAVWSHATHVAQAAASEALAAARTQDGTTGTGLAAARGLLDDLADGPLRDPVLDVSRGAQMVSVSIRGEAAGVLPGVHLPVHAEVSGAIERFVPDLPAAAP
ncbi:TadE/TadG family type IV pilus assembly protein [Amycolatopsis camponoti]|nr:TadE/TadG family type IV pilus assembly protein [Amycolatopsis camponoti]